MAAMFQTITSPANATVKMLKSLHAKKGRQETGLFLAEGLRSATEAAAIGVWPQVLLVSRESLERDGAAKLARAAAANGATVIETSAAILEAVSKRDNAQTVIGAYRQQLSPLSELVPDTHSLIVALDGVRDPGNLGTVLRTADSIGADAVVLTGAPCDPFSIEAVRASMGSIFTVRLIKTTLDALDAWRRRAALAMVGTHLSGAQRHDDFPVDRGVVLLMGTEQTGLDVRAAAACDHLVKIPMRGRADSLNLAIATSIIAYDVWRRRGYPGAKGSRS